MLLPAYTEYLTFLLCGVYYFNESPWFCSSKKRDVAWLSPLALGEVSVVAETTGAALLLLPTVQGTELDGKSWHVVLTIASLRTLIIAGVSLKGN